MKLNKAVFPAAGLGTRFLPATKSQPKEMLPIVDKPSIQYGVEEAIESGIENILFITGRDKRALEDHFDYSFELEYHLKEAGKIELYEQIHRIGEMADIHYIRQKEPRGLGHAVLCAKTFVGNDPFAVILGDDIIRSEVPCIEQMKQIFNKYRTSVIAVQKVPRDEISNYGVIDAVEIEPRVYRIKGMIEKPKVEDAPSNLAIVGRYILMPDIIPILEHTSPGRNNEIQITDALLELNNSEEMIGYLFEGKRYDIGTILGFLEATVEEALKRPDIKDAFRSFIQKRLDKIG